MVVRESELKEVNTPVLPALTVMPNVVSSRSAIQFKMPASGKATLALIDATGRRVKDLGTWTGDEGMVIRTEINRAGLMPGTYLVELRQGRSRMVTRVVIP
jgi:hypothetical protein